MIKKNQYNYKYDFDNFMISDDYYMKYRSNNFNNRDNKKDKKKYYIWITNILIVNKMKVLIIY